MVEFRRLKRPDNNFSMNGNSKKNLQAGDHISHLGIDSKVPVLVGFMSAGGSISRYCGWMTSFLSWLVNLPPPLMYPPPEIRPY